MREVFGSIAVVIALVGFGVGAFAMFKRLPRILLTDKTRAGIVLVGSFWLLVAGAAIVPNEKKSEAPAEKVASAPATTAVPTAAAAAPTAAVAAATAPTGQSSIPATAAPAGTALPPSAASATATQPQPTAAAPPLEQRIEKSIRDNKNAVKSGANLDGLAIQFDPSTGWLVVSVKPNNPDKVTQFLTNVSALAVITGKAVWTTYPEVNIISVSGVRDVKDSYGNNHTEGVVFAEYTRETGEKYTFANLKDQPSADNKTMFCTASFYQVSVELWQGLGNKGCMNSYAGGTAPTADQQQTIAVAAKPSSANQPKGGTPRIGDVVSVGSLDLTIISANAGFNSRQYNQFNSANVAIRVRATNARGDQGQLYDFSPLIAMVLVDSNGVAHTPEFGCAGCPDEIGTVSLVRGGTIQGNVYYAVPAGIPLAEIRYEPLFSRNKATISLK